MKIDFNEKNITGSDMLRAYAEKKLKKLDRYFKKEPEIRVMMRIEHERHNCEITLHSEGTFFRASVVTNDMYASIDACIASIERQIHKYRTKLEKRLHAKAFDPTPDYDPTPSDDSDFTLLRRKAFNLKPMTSDEAILQMNLLSHTFYVFRDIDNSQAFSVVYSRKNGGYGIISEE